MTGLGCRVGGTKLKRVQFGRFRHEERVESSCSKEKNKEKMANFCVINCCNTEQWVDVKPAEGIEGISEEEGTHKVVVNYPGGQVTSPN